MTETELVARLEKLERDNRRLKRLGVAALVLVGALGLMAATRPVPDVIKAHAFEVVDGQGMPRIKLAEFGPRSKGGEGEAIGLYDTNGDLDSMLSATPTGDALFLGQRGTSKNVPITLGTASGEAALTLLGGNGQLAVMGVSRKGPNVTLADSEGYATQIGMSSLVSPKTGETHQTSAASIVMFGNAKDHHVIWQAP